MAAAVSAVESFAQGRPLAVDPALIERELAALWQEAAETPVEGRPVTRACLWNVVASDLGSDAGSPWLEAAMTHLSEHLAARALVLRSRSEAWDEGSELRSWISAHCRRSAGGGRLVCSEEIRLEAFGAGVRHLPALVRALLVPGVPTAVVFGTLPEPGDPVAQALMRSADRIVLHAEHCGRADAFALFSRLGGGRSLVDLGWVAQAELRQAVGSIFDGAESDIPRLEVIEAQVAPDRRRDAVWVLAWIAARLAHGESPPGPNLDRVQTRHGPVELRVTSLEGASGVAVHFRGPGVHRCVRRDLEGGLRLERPSGIRRRAVDRKSESARLAQALLRKSQDVDFPRALRWAEALSL